MGWEIQNNQVVCSELSWPTPSSTSVWIFRRLSTEFDWNFSSTPVKWSNETWDCVFLELISPSHFLQQEWNLLLISENGSHFQFVAALGLPAFCWPQCSSYTFIYLFFSLLFPFFFLLQWAALSHKDRKEVLDRVISVALALHFGLGKQAALYSLGRKAEGSIKEWTGWKTGSKNFNLV